MLTQTQIRLLLACGLVLLPFACSPSDSTTEQKPTSLSNSSGSPSSFAGGPSSGEAGQTANGLSGSSSSGQSGEGSVQGGSGGASAAGSGGAESLAGAGGETVAGTGGQTAAGASGAGASGGEEGGAGVSGAAGTKLVSCPALAGSPMVAVPTPDGHSYCIDTRETNQAEYAAFLAVKEKDATGMPAELCSYKKGHTIPIGDSPLSNECPAWVYDPVKKPNAPMSCVDWCDAYAYCAWVGKRLCGRVGGGKLGAEEGYKDANVSEWYNACSQGGKTTYPYGNEFKAGTCYDPTYPGSKEGPKGVTPTCHGTEAPFDQIFDMQGNVFEWQNTCDGTYPGALCQTPGGSFGQTPDSSQCDHLGLHDSPIINTTHGIRCCHDGEK